MNAATAEAERRGVFGVPSFLVGDELFWGLDSLPMLEWRLSPIAADAEGRHGE